jgi:hypothetical protein
MILSVHSLEAYHLKREQFFSYSAIVTVMCPQSTAMLISGVELCADMNAYLRPAVH